MNKNCEVRNEFPQELQKPMEDLVDAFLYLGPPDLSLTEQTLAYIALDADYRKELQRRDSLTSPGRGLLQQFEEGIQTDAENPIDAAPIPPDFKLPRPAEKTRPAEMMEGKILNHKGQDCCFPSCYFVPFVVKGFALSQYPPLSYIDTDRFSRYS